MEIKCNNKAKTEEFIRTFAKSLRTGDVIALHGELGAGKTTIASLIAKYLGFTDRVQSPTFVLARLYKNRDSGKTSDGIKTIHHLDLYRIQKAEELQDFGINDYFNDPGAITLIEWPEVAINFLPKRTVHIYIEIVGFEERKINVQNTR